MSEMVKFTLIMLTAGILMVSVCGYTFDYFDKKRLERRNRMLIERSRTRQAMSCNQCGMVRHYQNIINEMQEEREYFEQTIKNLNIQNSILRSSLTKAKLHNETISEAQNEQTQ